MKSRRRFPKLFFITYIALCLGIILFASIHKFGFSLSAFFTTVATIVLLGTSYCLSIASAVIVHEFGHLIFGLLTGYKFAAIGFAHHLFLRRDGRMRRFVYKLPGALGFCAMEVPDMKDESFPFVLYLSGGVLCNAFFALICIFAFVSGIGSGILFFPHAFLLFAFVNAYLAIVSILPIKTKFLNTDGKQLFDLLKHKNIRKSFWICEKISAAQYRGVKFEDIPSEWFNETDDTQSVYAASIRAVRLLARAEAESEPKEVCALIEKELSENHALSGTAKGLLTCMRIYYEAIGERDAGTLKKLIMQTQIDFMKRIKNMPSAIQSEYAYTLLVEKDVREASRIKARLEKISKKYPFPAEIDTAKKLIARADEISKRENPNENGDM
ncbi:M50 family metallopeptidase [Treponema sp. Marseille-Q4132]|uniref:M50 family metallopeptidase n=1 Tax=Treponema sp. Marseille-Q4132 TaxID=2766701 RepID=UPI001652BB77|nr:M50 family metallopeptidase [Treponema sp. Marseille-Q4132]QNL97477.1 M50 family metallopeptidase [Treponema sp. Marseille-Q4132]